MKNIREICCECGHSVAPGSGRWVNRVPECNSYEQRCEMHRPFPTGEWLCEECDEQTTDDEESVQ